MPPKDKKCIKFVITETDRHPKGFTIYKVTSMICSKSDVASKVSIWKRYSEFKKLHHSMKSLYSSSRIKEPYPTFPKPKFFGRFEAEVIEERRLCALKFLEFIARYSSLFTSDIFVQFFESFDLETNKLDCTVSLSSESSEDDRLLAEEQAKKANTISLNEKPEQDKDEVHSRSPIMLHDGSDLPNSKESTSQYILIAAAHMSAAFRHEAIAEYEEAFTQYKLGISHLLNGVPSDPNCERRVLIQEKISKYLQRAEKLYNRHLNCNVSVLNKPVTELKNYKVFRVMDSMMLVKDVLRGFTRIIKTVEKVVGNLDDANNYILRGKVPYMVQLYGCVQTETTVFLILQYMSSGRLWDYIETQYKTKVDKKSHVRSSSCGAVMQVTQNETNSENQHDFSKFSELINDKSITESLPTTQLLENAQKLLQSVSATLQKSNSIASRLNESENLLYDIPSIKIDEDTFKEEENDLQYIDEDGDLSEPSITGSLTDLSSVKDKTENENSLMCDSIISDSKVSFGQDIINELWDSVVVDLEPVLWCVPEAVVRRWAAELICALEALHQQDVIIGDLRPENLLLTEDGHLALTYVVRGRHQQLIRTANAYIAPELRVFVHPLAITCAADVWSFGVLLYELLTGYQFQQKHVGDFHPHSTVNIPDCLSESAKSLLYSILKYSPNDRLTIPEIKQHSFFDGTDWLSFLNY